MKYKLYKVEGVELLVLVIADVVIVSDKEFCHEPFALEDAMTDTVFVPITIESEPNEEGVVRLTFSGRDVTVSEILQSPCREVDDEGLKEWAHYFGVKSRIRSNYGVFLNTVKEMAAIAFRFPNWEK